MPRAFSLAILLGALLAARSVRADTHVHVPAGGGLPSFDVSVSVKDGVVVVVWPRPAVPGGGQAQFPIGLEAAELPDDDDVQTEVVALGQGRHIVHVRVAVRGSHDEAWEALLVGGPGKSPIFAGRTGFGEGDPGERTGTAVQIAKGPSSSYALVGTLREDLRICGQARTLLDPRAVYPDSLDLRPATVQRISEDERGGATAIDAQDKGTTVDKPLGTLLVARGSSVAASTGHELTDGDAATWWHEDRPGVGQGEFVTMAAASRVPMTRVDVVLPPATPGGAGGPPRSFYLTTESQVFEVTLPDDAARKPGEVYEVAFPQPVATSCLSLVLDGAFARAATHPDVGLAEIVGYSEFDAPGAALEDVAKHLSGPRGDAAAEVLERAPAALGAVAAGYDALDSRGRARAVDVASSADKCEDAAPFLVHALCASGGVESEDVAGEAIRKAREKLERCPGAAPVLADGLRNDAASRACLAPLLARLAPADALVPLADAIAATPETDAKTRSVLRAAFGAVLAAAPAAAFASVAGDAKRSAAARLEMFRAAEGHVTDVRAEADAALGELLRGTPSMRVRYLALGPLGHLAQSGDATALGLLLATIAHDNEWPVRARAVEVAAGLPAAEAAVIAAASDPEPRVREAALSALAVAPSASAARASWEILGHDDWPFVKVQAIAVLMNAPSTAQSVEALGAALDDPSARVRGAAIVALARAGAAAASWRIAIRKKLDDRDEDADVRSAAASALGAMCDREAAGRLTELARPLAGVAADEDAREVGLGAVVGLAALHPPDLKERLAPLLAPSAPPAVRAAAAHAIAARARCP
jgi:hypothetical protein